MKLKFFSILIIMVFTMACERDKNPVNNSTTLTANATVHYTEPALDGCGYLIEIADVEYRPINQEFLFEWYKSHEATK